MKDSEIKRHLEHIVELLKIDGINSKLMALNDLQHLIKELNNETSNDSSKQD